MERREHTRTRVWIPVEVRTEAVPQVLGVSHDLSRKGVLVSAAQPIAVGVRVTATLSLPAEPPVTRVLGGRVVRSGRNEDDPDGLWPFRFAIAFDEPIDEVDGL